MAPVRLSTTLSESDLGYGQSGINLDTGLANAANTVIPANAGIQEIVQNVLTWTPAYAGVTKDFTLQVRINYLLAGTATPGIFICTLPSV